MIIVTIPAETAMKLDNDINFAMYCLNELKNAGVPVVGHIYPRAERGKLIQYIDAFGDIVFTWEDA